MSSLFSVVCDVMVSGRMGLYTVGVIANGDDVVCKVGLPRVSTLPFLSVNLFINNCHFSARINFEPTHAQRTIIQSNM